MAPRGVTAPSVRGGPNKTRYALRSMKPSAEHLPARPAEAHALAVARTIPATRIVCTTSGRGQAATRWRSSVPMQPWWHGSSTAIRATRRSPRGAPVPANLTAACVADMPSGPHDLAVVPLAKDGEAELSRDILQAALANLAIGGHLVAAIDNPHDTWLHGQLAATGETVRVRPAAGANPKSKTGTIAYLVEKTSVPVRMRDFSCEVVFRDRGNLLTAFTRPGVFAHRRIDPGARHLLNAVDVAADTRVLDIGCGSGCVALGIAARDGSVTVHAFDSSARAVDCTRRGSNETGWPT